MLFRGGSINLGPGVHLSHNIASQQGGGMAWQSGCLGEGSCPSDVQVSCRAAVRNNTAAVAGGGVFLGDSSLDDVSVSTDCIRAAAQGNSAPFGNSDFFSVRGSCSMGQVSVGGGWCTNCAANMYSFDANGTNACELCPSHAVCKGGDSGVAPLPGFWHSHNYSTQVHACPNRAACQPGSGYASATDPGYVDWQCAEGYEGTLCGRCSAGFGRRSTFVCGKCMSKHNTIVMFAVAMLLILSLLAYMAYATHLDNRESNPELRVSDCLKVLVLYFQYALLLATSTVEWPKSISAVFLGLGWVLSSCTGQLMSLDCILAGSGGTSAVPLAMQRQLLYLLTPVIMMLALGLVYSAAWIVLALVRHAKRRPGSCTMAAFSAWMRMRLPVIVLVVLFFYFPSLVRVSWSLFACFSVDQPGEGPYPQYLVKPGAFFTLDMSQQCWQGWHKQWALGLGIPLVVIFCLGVPAGIALLLWRNRHRTQLPDFRQHCGFLYRTFRPGCVCYEAVVAAITVCLAAISVFSTVIGPYYECVLFTVVFATSLVLQIWLRPYAFERLHYMQLAASGCLLVTSFATLTFFNMDRDTDTSALYKEVMGGIILAINAVFVVYCIVCVVLLAQGMVRRLLQRLLNAELAWFVRLLPKSLVSLLRLPSGHGPCDPSDPSVPFGLYKSAEAAGMVDLEADMAQRSAGKDVQKQQPLCSQHGHVRGPPKESTAGPAYGEVATGGARVSASGRDSWHSSDMADVKTGLSDDRRYGPAE
eukprot:GHRQ01013628.1.p1 GENE.GHRQ01013628.1~~GHRQ01013628.1.p1  ORF type:complete len:755 (+),score=199.59 GHRQ01013628.1:639-2903(+)